VGKHVYTGSRQPEGCVVLVDGESLEPRLDLVNHSPTGFEWGYLGSGPAQLALAMLAHHLGDDQQALELYQDFKVIVVANLPPVEWSISSAGVEAGLAAIRAARE